MEKMEADTALRPDYFRLPSVGKTDKLFGLSRNMYYVGERRGYWKLLRVKTAGKPYGITLVPVSQVSSFLNTQHRAQSTE